jgi:Cytosine/uracil/thiamine/allantoin permeases
MIFPIVLPPSASISHWFHMSLYSPLFKSIPQFSWFYSTYLRTSILTCIGFDLAATFPRFINIRRGAYITALISIACNPWKLVNTATTFLAVLSSYSVFLGPMTGLMVSSYFVVNRRRIKVDDLFVGSSQSIYWYTFGVNWRAIVAVCNLIPFSSF